MHFEFFISDPRIVKEGLLPLKRELWRIKERQEATNDSHERAESTYNAS